MGLKPVIGNGRRKKGAVLGTAFFLSMMLGAFELRADTLENDSGILFRRRELKQNQTEQRPVIKKIKSRASVRKKRKPAQGVSPTALPSKKEEVNEVLIEQQSDMKQELKEIEKELLQFPKKDRIRMGGDFDFTYEDNVGRLPVHHDEGETIFKLSPFAQLDLSGQRTELRLEYRTRHTYNVKRSEIPGNDSFIQEGTVRVGRKILPHTLFSLNERLGRTSTRTAGHDNKKIQWDQSHRAALNYEMSKKFSISLDGSHSRTDFPNESFDENYTRSWTLNPGLFFQMTPKTRLSGNYALTYSRAQTKTSDNTKHEFRVGYFGQLTTKSSASLDVSLSHQVPDSADASRSNQIVWSGGYIWQATPKTSFRLLYSTTLSRATTDSLDTDGPLMFTKTRTDTHSDSLSFSTRWRIHRKITTDFSFDGAHSRNKTNVVEGDSATTKTRQWTLPFQVGLDVELVRWVRLRFTYTFRYRLGDERKTDEFRAHTFFGSANIAV